MKQPSTVASRSGRCHWQATMAIVMMAMIVGTTTSFADNKNAANTTGNWATDSDWVDDGGNATTKPVAGDTVYIGRNVTGGANPATITVNSAEAASSAYLGGDNNSYTGTLNITGGSLTLSGELRSGHEGIGYLTINGGNIISPYVDTGWGGNSSGRVDQISGDVTAANQVRMAWNGGSRSFWDLASGNKINVGDRMYVGYDGTPIFNVASGSSLELNNLNINHIDWNPPAGVIVRRSTPSVSGIDGEMYLGERGGGTMPGEFTQNDDYFYIGGYLRMAWNGGSTGIYNLASGKTVDVQQVAYIGYDGDATMNAAAGSKMITHSTVSISGNDFTPPAGFFKMADGTTAGIQGELHLAERQAVPVTFYQSDPYFTINSHLRLGFNGGTEATYDIDNGETVRVNNVLYLGYDGDGYIDAESGAKLIMNSWLSMSGNDWAPPAGFLYMNDETTPGIQGGLHIGERQGVPVKFTQNDTTFNIGSELRLGYNSGQDGTYEIGSGKTLIVHGTARIGQNGDGYMVTDPASEVQFRGWVSVNQNDWTPTNGVYKRSDGTTPGVGNLHIGEVATAATIDFYQNDPTFEVGELRIGYNGSTKGAYHLDAGEQLKSTSHMYIGHSGEGELVAPAGSTALVNSVSISGDSWSPPTNFFYHLNGTTPGIQGNFYVAHANQATTVEVTQPDVLWTVGGEMALSQDGSSSFARYYLGTNRLDVNGWLKAPRHAGVFDMRGGILGGSGHWQVGEINTDLQQELVGYGEVVKTTDFYNRARVIADGGTLSITNASNIRADYDCVLDADDSFTWTERRGWFAQNGGKLELKAITVATGNNSYNWGEQAADTEPDMVNALRFAFNNTTTGDELKVDLLADDHADTPDGLRNIVGVWDIQPGGSLAFTDVDIQFRYDDKLANDYSIAENDLRVFKHDGSAWSEVTSGVSIDAAKHILTVANVTGFSKWAIAEDFGLVNNVSGADPIGTTTATLNGNLLATNGVPTSVWVYWGTTNGAQVKAHWEHVEAFGIQSAGSFSTNLTGLLEQQQYYYTFYASNSLTEAWAPSASDFQTLGAPVVSTLAPNGITANASTLRAGFTAGGSGTVRFYWGTSDQGASYTAWDHIEDLGTKSQGTHTSNVTVEAGQRYYVRAYVTNTIGEAWGDTVSFVASRAAQVTISGVQNAEDNHNPGATVVFTDDQTGYVFYPDSTGSGRLYYRKSTDGGESWGSGVEISSAASWRNISIWYDQWTPGDESGTKIYIAAATESDEDFYYTHLDTATDTLKGSMVKINSADGINDWGYDDGNASITKATDGNLYAYVAANFASGNRGFVARSTDSGDTWTEIMGSSAGLNDRADKGQLLPLSGGDVLLIYGDMANDGLSFMRSRVWDAGSSAWDASWNLIDQLFGRYSYDVPWSAVVDKYTGDVYLVLHTDIRSYNGNVKLYKFDETARSWSVESTMIADTDGKIAAVDLMLDENNGDLYATYAKSATHISGNNNPDDLSIYYRKSTDGGQTWSSESSALNSTADDYRIVRGGHSSDDRLYVFWFDIDDSAIIGRTVANLDSAAFRISNADGATAISGTSATLNGDLMKTNGAANAVHIAWGDEDGGVTTSAWDSVISLGNLSAGAFNDTVTTVAGTHYYYRTFVELSAGGSRAWAPETAEFGTDGAPAVNTKAATSVRGGVATLNGELVSDGGATTEVRFYYGDNDAGTTKASWDSMVSLGTVNEGDFSQSVSGLIPGSANYVRAYATNASGEVWGDTLTVTPSGGIVYVDVNLATGNNDGTSWADAYTTLTAALAAATTNDAIWVAQGTYAHASDTTFSLGNKAIYGGFDNGDTWADRDPATKETILDGAQVATHVITGAGTIDGFTIKRGGVGASGNNNGAAIYIASAGASELIIRNSIFTNNVAAWHGGAIWVYRTRLPITIEDTVFANNKASTTVNHSGGAIQLDGTYEDVVMRRVTFRDNSLESGTGVGGALHVTDDSGNLYFEDCVFDGNSTVSGDANGGGGAIYVNSTIVSATFEGCTFTDNSTSVGSGGAVYFYSTMETAIFTNCTFNGNESGTGAYGGGAIAFSHVNDGAYFYDTDFYNNSAANAGAGGAVHSRSGHEMDTMWFENCEFTNNVASTVGGAIYQDRVDGQRPGGSFFTNCLFYANYNTGAGQYGGAAYINEGTVEIYNSVVSNNWGNGYGGAFFIGAVRNTNEIIIADSHFVGNTNSRYYGGAVYIGGNSPNDALVLVTNSLFKGNIGHSRAGALYLDNALEGTVVDTDFINNKTISDADSGEGGGAVYAYHYDDGLTFRNVTFTSNVNEQASAGGGALRVDMGNGSWPLLFDNCTFTANETEQSGGSIYLHSGQLTITNSTFVDGVATNGAGFVYVEYSDGGIVIADSVFSNAVSGVASTTWGSQGALLCFNQGSIASLDIDNSVFYGGQHLSNDKNGGAIYFAGGNTRPVSIHNSTFENNLATEDGGAIYIGDSLNTTVSNVTFRGNITRRQGGAVRVVANGAGGANFYEVDFISNSSTNNETYAGGGAVHVADANGGVHFENCLFAKNSSLHLQYGGGAIHLEGSDTANILNSTFYGNTAENDGGAIMARGFHLNITNSIFRANTADAGASGNIYAWNGFTYDIDYTYIDTAEIRNQGSATINVGGDVSDTDPLFADVGNDDYHVQSLIGRWDGSAWVTDSQQSPAIDAGDPTYSFAREPAPNGGIVNIGRYANTDEASKSVPALIENTGAENIQANSADLTALLTVDNDPPTTVRFYYWEDGAGPGGTNLTAGNVVAAGEGLTNTIGGLLGDTTYHYRAAASNASGEVRATNVITFATAGAPNVTNVAATGVTETAATLRGRVIRGGSGDVTIYWGTTDGGIDPVNWDDNEVMGNRVQGVTYSTNLTGLTGGQTYFYRSYVTNANGEAWASPVESFTTDLPAASAIDSTMQNAYVQYNSQGDTVFVNANTGYVFYVDDSTYPAYRKTTDGGANWSAPTALAAGGTWIQLAVWYDRWTPGDESGTEIHLAAIGDAGDEILYNSLDTADDSTGSWVQANTGDDHDDWGDTHGNITITKATDGNIFIAVASNFVSSDDRGLVARSTDGGSTWTLIMGRSEGLDSRHDNLQVLPLSDGDIMLLKHNYQNDQTLQLESKVWDASGSSWDAAWTQIAPVYGNNAYDTCWGATVDKYSGDVYLAASTYIYNPSRPWGRLKAFKYDDGDRAWSHQSDIIVDTNGTVGVTHMMVDNNSGNLYAVYVKGTLNSSMHVYYRTSSDEGLTWSAEQGPISSVAGYNNIIRGTMAGDARLYATWYDDNQNDLYGNTIAVLPQQAYRIGVTSATNVQETTANLNAEVFRTNGVAHRVYFAYGTTDGGTVVGDWDTVTLAAIDPGVDTVSLAVSGLTSGTRYYVRAYIENTAGGDRVWTPGVEKMYTAGAPFVDVLPAENVLAGTATLKGNLRSDGGAATTVTLYWGDDDPGATTTGWDHNESIGVTDEGDFSLAINTAVLGVPNYFRARAVNSEGSHISDAQSFFPNGQYIYVDESATVGNDDGSSWSDAYLLLQDALAAANTDDIILVAEGTYQPATDGTQSATFTLTGKTVWGGFPAGGAAINARDWDANEVILSGDVGLGNYAYHVVTGYGTLDGVTVKDGASNGSGGGVFINGAGTGDLIIRNSVFTNNTSASHGGAIYINDSATALIVENTVFANNGTDIATDGERYGGVAYVHRNSAEITFTDCTFNNNYARRNGGVLNIDNSSGAVTFDNCTFTENSVLSGGGDRGGGAVMNNTTAYAVPSFTFRDCTFTDNSSGTAQGGAIYLISETTEALITNCTFNGNSADESGGAIATRGIQKLTVIDTDFFNNEASNGSGAAIWLRNDSEQRYVTVRNATFTNNVSRYDGGAFYSSRANNYYPDPFIFSNVTFIGNSTTNGDRSGGAIYLNRGNWEITDATFTDNSVGGSGGALYLGGGQATGTLVIANSTFTSNTNRQYDGGAVWIGGDNSDDDVVITNVTFTGSRAGRYGGAVNFGSTMRSLVLEDVTFTGSRSGNYGGALYGNDFVNGFTMRNVDFIDNKAQSEGGAFRFDMLDGNQRPIWIESCNFLTNTAVGAGGSIYIRDYGATITNSVFRGNETVGTGEGGAIWANSVTDGSGAELTIVDSEFTQNISDNTAGALRLSDGADTVIRNTTFTSNMTSRIRNDWGGAISISGGSAASSLSIFDSTFTTNTATQDGGAIYANTALYISNSVFRSNYAERRGGVIYRQGGTLEAYETDFIGNTADQEDGNAGGGAILLEGGEATILRNCLFAKNVSTSPGDRGGGAIRLDVGGSGWMTIENSTFADNTSVYHGGAIRVGSGHMNITNTIFYGNTSDNQGNDIWAANGYTLNMDYSLMSDTNNIHNQGSATINLGANVIEDNPLFADAANNKYQLLSSGGWWDFDVPGWDLSSGSTSPGIDAGDPSYDVGDEPSPNGGQINLGRYGGTQYASRSGLPGGSLFRFK